MGIILGRNYIGRNILVKLYLEEIMFGRNYIGVGLYLVEIVLLRIIFSGNCNYWCIVGKIGRNYIWRTARKSSKILKLVDINFYGLHSV